jgi:hypothetical protein
VTAFHSTHFSRPDTSSEEHVCPSERTAAVQFFARYGNDVPCFRHYMSESTGIAAIIREVKAVEAGTIDNSHWNSPVWYLCEVLAELSSFRWCIPVLMQLDLCLTLAKLLWYAIMPIWMCK